MALELRLSNRLDLQLKLAPQIIQSIEILQLASMDLQSLVEQELDTNDYLEIAPPELTPTDDSETTGTSTTEQGTTTEQRATEFSALEAQGYWDEELPRYKNAINHEASDRKQEAMNNTAGPAPSLHEFLLDQFHLLEIDELIREVGEDLIFSIDTQGRLELDLDRLKADHEGATETHIATALTLIHGLEPKGIGARSTEECLLLQLDPKDPNIELKRRLVGEFLEDLIKNRRPKIAKALMISLEQLEELVHDLMQLDFQPGRTAIAEEPHYIYPDIVVEWAPNGYEVRLANSRFPSLVVDDSYKEVIGNKEVPTEYKDQVRKQVEGAKWLISAIEQRQSTLMRVAKRIVHYQRDFLEFGPHYLAPLKMQQIADDLGIHVSTVSRATHEKYMQTHRGIFALKFFFSGATKSVDGGVESRSSVKQRVREIIDQEDKKSPLSDEEIVKRLKASFGVDVARRTITKYRKALDIPSTRQRRQY